MERRGTTVHVWAADGCPVPGGTWVGPLVRELRHAGFDVRVVPLSRRPPTSAELAAPLHVLSGGNTAAAASVPWMGATRTAVAELVARAHAGEARAVGVCLGAQLLATALAGPRAAGPSAAGMEAGLHVVHATDPTADPSTSVVAEFHHHAIDHDRLVAAGATVTLGNDHTAVQGFVVGAGITGYQFHPELSPAGIGAVVRANGPLLRATGVEPAVALATVREHAAAWDATVFRRLVVDRLTASPHGGPEQPVPAARTCRTDPLAAVRPTAQPSSKDRPCAASPSLPTASTARRSSWRSPT